MALWFRVYEVRHLRRPPSLPHEWCRLRCVYKVKNFKNTFLGGRGDADGEVLPARGVGDAGSSILLFRVPTGASVARGGGGGLGCSGWSGRSGTF